MNTSVPPNAPDARRPIDSGEQEPTIIPETLETPEALTQRQAAKEATLTRETAQQAASLRADIDLSRDTREGAKGPETETLRPETAAPQTEKQRGEKTLFSLLIGGISFAATKIKEILERLGFQVSEGLAKLSGKAKEKGKETAGDLQETAESLQKRAKTVIHELNELLRVEAPVFTFLKGKNPRITSLFGHREDPMHEGKEDHKGVDITLGEGNTDLGEPILATRPLKVLKPSVSDSGGNAVTLQDPEHPEMTYTFRHLEERPPFTKGQILYVGQEIARIGDTGTRTRGGAHLHFEARRNGEIIDPLSYTGLA